LKICPQKILLRLRWVIVSFWLLLLVGVPALWVRSYWNCDIVRRRSQHVTSSGLTANWFAFGTFGDGCTGMAFGWLTAKGDPKVLKQANLSWWQVEHRDPKKFPGSRDTLLHRLGFLFVQTNNAPVVWTGLPDGQYKATGDFLYIFVPPWAIELLLLAPGVVMLYRRMRRGPGEGFCPVCGYDLRATPERCPECGAVPNC